MTTCLKDKKSEIDKIIYNNLHEHLKTRGVINFSIVITRICVQEIPISCQGDGTLTFLPANARHDFVVSELRMFAMLNELLNIIHAS